ncbi:bifunctional transcriptional activator/DNA repair protein Ada [Sulfitobacter pseudonitzschiae]|uniref:methylated-DNA--[protein]-cysteine S-methyltransferase n=1 Tax=Pseudosulfitobacter pseudonitzschiae TaxID=1402135 RepID=A0A9Q2RY99_9RHOB|nr:bifunctional transcriptional activator/DNA repair protein Ada [Pseudosulfitobacter pseudonitzschiae]MBM2298261.1 bifunctional transcriptional activator/DNA repair protein Ada [Pseudosulfitobacter pseudonitzschiae]MBM2303175.1 bifunctional transcriptional activator/DNA repair protein Ada [Pseudosulfitobacter pseudonitzschiae]MBM2312958.1 bifunctional transcriptional activator/DNA repair protein Ada [Pseudosulfitobacter pseudonitzschiae]MBM2317871.1 bifunctional transcriptional activator/DNA r
MLFDLPDHDTLYRALLARDDRYDGHAFVCVSSTGVFCRLTCPARKPKRENCTFHDTVGACIEAGFRPCKRCHPLQPMASGDPAIAAMLAALDERPAFRWSETDVVRMGFDPSTIRRSFKRQFGMTFLEMARQRRLRDGFETMSSGGKVIEAQIDAQFDSASAFSAAFARLLGRAPGRLDRAPLLFADWVSTPLGDMISVTSQTELHLLEFTDRKALKTELGKLDAQCKGRLGIGQTAPGQQLKAELAAFFAGTSAVFATPLAYHGAPFAQLVWDELRRIPPGVTRSYSQIAAQIGRPEATRAVGRANGANQIALVVPCHRVIGADGALTGYGGGLWRKQKLLEIERQYLPAPQERAQP